MEISTDEVIRRCVSEHDIPHILDCCHNFAVRGHFGPQRTARKALDSGFF